MNNTDSTPDSQTDRRASALIVDDETDICRLIQMTLAKLNVHCDTAGNLAEARELLAIKKFDFCITDLRLKSESGFDLLEYIQEHHPLTPVAMITAHGSVEAAVNALKAGAFDFVSKPIAIDQLRNMVASALKLVANRSDPAVESQAAPTRLIGSSDAITSLRKQILKVARTRTPILITGESGTGKELAAQMIHHASPQAAGPFIPVNCGAIPTDLIESELFGHIKGSFSGATSDREGLFRAAHGGTLFLDEIADLPLSMQVKLLRAIQEKKIRPVGSDNEVDTEVRLVSATHEDLANKVHEGSFRQDLFYRLNVINLHIPPLRERTTDIKELTAHILQQLAEEHQSELAHLDETASAAMSRYPFPGNVRELENVLARGIAMAENGLITAEDLGLNSEVESLITPEAKVDQLPIELENLERQRIEQALMDNKYNKTAAAKQLGITFRALRYRLKKLNID